MILTLSPLSTSCEPEGAVVPPATGLLLTVKVTLRVAELTLTTKTSVLLLLSPATKFAALERQAIKSPFAEINGKLQVLSAGIPASDWLIKVGNPAWRS